MAQIYDITPPISSKLAVFPGDQPFSRTVAMSFGQGHHLELSSILTTVHLGAHADAPSHYHASGRTLEKQSLAPYMGLAQMVRVPGLKPKQRILPKDITVSIRAPRVLFDSGSFQNPEQWNPDFNSLSPELIEWLAKQNVRLVGIDTPSVDPEDAKHLATHEALFRYDVAVLEGLILKDTPEGLYTLIALPLPIVGADASPVRAVLLPPIQDFPDCE